jgi:hypothetical protein
MATIKDEARKLIDALPDDCRWEDMLYRFHVRQRIEEGLRDIDEGRVIFQEELEREVETWFGSAGASQPAWT